MVAVVGRVTRLALSSPGVGVVPAEVEATITGFGADVVEVDQTGRGAYEYRRVVHSGLGEREVP